MRFTPTGKCADIAKIAAGVQRGKSLLSAIAA
jgi:hypothetical protein